VDYNESLPGVSFAEHQQSHARKPFWGPDVFQKYAKNFARLLRVFNQLGLKPGSRLLELGCGVGWMAEFLAVSGYSVVGTTIAPNDIQIAEKRAEAFRVRGLPELLDFYQSQWRGLTRRFKLPETLKAPTFSRHCSTLLTGGPGSGFLRLFETGRLAGVGERTQFASHLYQLSCGQALQHARDWDEPETNPGGNARVRVHRNRGGWSPIQRPGHTALDCRAQVIVRFRMSHATQAVRAR